MAVFFLPIHDYANIFTTQNWMKILPNEGTYKEQKIIFFQLFTRK